MKQANRYIDELTEAFCSISGKFVKDIAKAKLDDMPFISGRQITEL